MRRDDINDLTQSKSKILYAARGGITQQRKNLFEVLCTRVPIFVIYVAKEGRKREVERGR